MLATTEAPHQQVLPSVQSNQRFAQLSAAPIRVCFLIDELAVAGTETQLLALIRSLDRSRILPYLCLLRGSDARSRCLEPTDCPVMRFRVGAWARPAAIPPPSRFVLFLRSERTAV